MTTNVEVTRKKNENNITMLKRFTRRVQESGVLKKVRSNRYLERDKSPLVKKQQKVKSLAKTEEYQKLVKLGKAPERRGRRR